MFHPEIRSLFQKIGTFGRDCNKRQGPSAALEWRGLVGIGMDSCGVDWGCLAWHGVMWSDAVRCGVVHFAAPITPNFKKLIKPSPTHAPPPAHHPTVSAPCAPFLLPNTTISSLTHVPPPSHPPTTPSSRLQSTNTSRWFDRLVKIGVNTGLVDKEWFSPGIYLTEASNPYSCNIKCLPQDLVEHQHQELAAQRLPIRQFC